MENTLLSLIVPVYNVEKYITKCLYSISNQSYDNIEVIVVDDGSTDRSGMICDEIALSDDRIRVIHTDNNGVSSARNKGISLARGRYLAFVDADDYIEENMYRILIDDLEGNDADIAMCNICHSRKGRKLFGNNEYHVEIYSGIEMLEHLYGNNYVLAVVIWNKVYKTELFKDIHFPEGLTREDEFIMHRVMYNANIITFRDQGMYHYMTHKGSITRQRDLGRINRLIAVESRMQFFRDKEMQKLYYLSLLRLLNDSARCYFYVKAYFDDKNVLQSIRCRFMKYYEETIEMKAFFRKEYIYPKLFIAKYMLIKVFFVFCKLTDKNK